MVGLSKNSSNLISRTNARMHAGEDIWEIRQIVIGNGTRVAKEVTTGMMMMRGLVTMAVMELVAKTRVTMGPVTSRVMMMTRAAMMTGLMTTVTMMGLVAMTEPVTTKLRMAWNITRMSNIWGSLRKRMERPILLTTIVAIQ